jgi:UDP-4-amino-4-deoxy-L-arabinose-oxoglutarate aminotransferase
LKNTKFRIPKVQNNILHSRHLYPIGVGSFKRDEILSTLANNGIGITVNYRAVPNMTFYKKKYNLSNNKFPVSDMWGQETLSLPLYPNITVEEQKYVVKILIDNIEPMIG